MVQRTLAPIEDDTEDAPWMVMGSPQSRTAIRVFDALDTEIRLRGSDLYIAMMLPVLFAPIPGGRIERLAPDILVAPVPYHDRNSYRVEEEGVPPSFLLEIVSEESLERDFVVKRERYEVMGAQEYALFAPILPGGRVLVQPQLQGYRLDERRGEYTEWEADEQGRLYSRVLDLWLAVRDGELRLQRGNGSLVPTAEEEVRARQEAERARQEAERARQEAERARQEAERARQEAEAEVVRLRQELERRGPN